MHRPSIVIVLAAAVACGGDRQPSSPASPAIPGTPAVIAPGTNARAWDLVDVSMLLPFPTAADLPRMLQPTTKGARGELIPKAWLDTIPKPLAVNVDHATTIAQLRAVGIRIDPCFRAAASSPCRHQVRMSWQPFVERGGTLSSVDAAAHTFYELAPADFTKLADRLWALRQPVSAGAPLDVHPLLAQQGLGGEYWTALQAALLDYCGAESLSRLTVMQLGGRTNVWVFTGVEQDASGKRAPITIARIASPIQTIGVHAQPPTQFDGGLYKANVTPTDHLEPPEQPELNKFLRMTAGLDVRSDAGRAMLVKVLDSIRFLEVPSAESTSETIDCASCHIAQAARVWIGKHAPGVAPTLPDYANTAGFNLENESPLAGLTNQLRAFGYIQQSAVISQRTIYESAIVAEQMRQRSR